MQGWPFVIDEIFGTRDNILKCKSHDECPDTKMCAILEYDLFIKISGVHRDPESFTYTECIPQEDCLKLPKSTNNVDSVDYIVETNLRSRIVTNRVKARCLIADYPIEK